MFLFVGVRCVVLEWSVGDILRRTLQFRKDRYSGVWHNILLSRSDFHELQKPRSMLEVVVVIGGVPLDNLFLGFRRILCNMFGPAFGRRFGLHNHTVYSKVVVWPMKN